MANRFHCLKVRRSGWLHCEEKDDRQTLIFPKKHTAGVNNPDQDSATDKVQHMFISQRCYLTYAMCYHMIRIYSN